MTGFTKYFLFSKADPVAADYDFVNDLANELDIYMAYDTFFDNRSGQDVTKLGGFVVLPNRMRIWEASDLLPGFTIRYTEGFHEIEEVLKRLTTSTWVNSHPLTGVTEDLRLQFEQELNHGEQITPE